MQPAAVGGFAVSEQVVAVEAIAHGRQVPLAANQQRGCFSFVLFVKN